MLPTKRNLIEHLGVDETNASRILNIIGTLRIARRLPTARLWLLGLTSIPDDARMGMHMISRLMGADSEALTSTITGEVFCYFADVGDLYSYTLCYLTRTNQYLIESPITISDNEEQVR